MITWKDISSCFVLNPAQVKKIQKDTFDWATNPNAWEYQPVGGSSSSSRNFHHFLEGSSFSTTTQERTTGDGTGVSYSEFQTGTLW